MQQSRHTLEVETKDGSRRLVAAACSASWSRFFWVQNDFFGIQKFVLDIFGVKGIPSIVKLFLAFWKVISGQGGSFNGQRPKKAAGKQDNRKSKTVQKQKEAATTTSRTRRSKLTKQQHNSSNTAAQKQNKQQKHFGRSKAAKIGFSTVGDLKAPAAATPQTTRNSSISGSKSNTNSKKNSTQHESQHQTKNWPKQQKMVKSGKGVFFIQQTTGARRPEWEGERGQPRAI